jgi:hypothetical protein
MGGRSIVCLPSGFNRDLVHDYSVYVLGRLLETCLRKSVLRVEILP